jgi:hypothetical protein
MLQQSQVSSMQTYYQTQQHQFSHEQQLQQVQNSQQTGDAQPQEHSDVGIKLHEYFSSPEAIQVFSTCHALFKVGFAR